MSAIASTEQFSALELDVPRTSITDRENCRHEREEKKFREKYLLMNSKSSSPLKTSVVFRANFHAAEVTSTPGPPK